MTGIDGLGVDETIIIRYNFTIGRREINPGERARAERLAAVLSAARAKRRWSVQELSIESGVHYETVRSVLVGKSAGPSFFIVADLARALQVPLEQLGRRTKR